MPLTSLKKFLKDIENKNKKQHQVKLVLKTSQDIQLFLNALRDSRNQGISSLSALDLSGTHFTPAELRDLIGVLNNIPGIKCLRLDSCALNDGDTVELSKLTHIKELSLKSNHLKNRPMFNTMLEALYLDYNTELSASYVLFSLSRNAATLKKLSLRNCGVTDANLDYLTRPESRLKNLTHFNLRRNNITYLGVDSIAHLPSLTTIDLSQNTGIADEGVSRLAPLKQLRTVYLDNCGVGIEGIKAIAKMNLYTVDLSFNPGLKKEWGLDEIRPNHTIRTLLLTFCCLNDNHAKLIVSKFPAATNLNVANNNMTRAGVKVLLSNPIIESLDVSTQSLYAKPTGVSGSGMISPRIMMKKKEIKQQEKGKVQDLLDTICNTITLKSISLEHTGITPRMLLSLIPDETDHRRYLKKINGISCKELKPKLEQQIALRKAEKQSSPPVIIEMKDSNPSDLTIKPGNDSETKEQIREVHLQGHPDERIKALELENQKLKDELALARKRIVELEKQPSSGSKSRKNPPVPRLAIPVMFQDFEKPGKNKTDVNTGNFMSVIPK
ncbi:secretion system protein [Legionella pneumophila]|uniref:Leucine-rich repeat protein Substrate of the Dot/Icm secretion system n=1 Tax=Legionella pneumophila subsp. pascullei TaxID=91890 RepID=A0AAX2IY10_LEGPN|nr:secretion system protein [Legionella pneumophila]AMP92859.1 secretion system protein [Legionella pneumophila subsp. pascullei]AMP95825.1 secretion system protein [Legionella pneumophila subsp. pascullei]SQG90742.1 Leucine-rich repeat protein Substrate of the Dot/Icm secretion system [Legionella pneumophila subsp. pascullei]VEH07287.1 Leucine-rich repeat protein Substrate of the Dot/Icm secretion system [Legionella pneumophila subsp. pascullei]